MSTEIVRDRNNNVIGYIIQEANGDLIVRDKNNNVLGYVNNLGTWDKNRRPISRSKIPGLLLDSVR